MYNLSCIAANRNSFGDNFVCCFRDYFIWQCVRTMYIWYIRYWHGFDETIVCFIRQSIEGWASGTHIHRAKWNDILIKNSGKIYDCRIQNLNKNWSETCQLYISTGFLAKMAFKFALCTCTYAQGRNPFEKIRACTDKTLSLTNA